MLATSDAHRVSRLRRVWLVRDYVDAATEEALLGATTGAAARWTHVSGRRLQALGARTRACSLAGELPLLLRAAR